MGISSRCELTIYTPHGMKTFIVVFNILSMPNITWKVFLHFQMLQKIYRSINFSFSLNECTMFSQCCTIFLTIFVHFDLNLSICILDFGTLLRRATIGGSCVEPRSSLDSFHCEFALVWLCLYMVGLLLIKESYITSK